VRTYKPLPSQPTPDKRCGTYAGSTAHTYRNEKMCNPCRIAYAEYQRMWRFKGGKQHDMGRCLECGSVFPGHQCATSAAQRGEGSTTTREEEQQ